MNILICNDDGYQSKGIALLARVASEFANVRVIAPDRNRTAASHSLTLHKALSVNKAENGFYYVNGTPTDCVHLAISIFDDFKPDWVLSGVNHGANMGDDTLYSGTVAAATEGYLLGVPSVAFSLDDKSDVYWDTAEKVLFTIIQYLIKLNITEPVLWNINIPKVAAKDLQGIKTVRLGQRHHGQSVITTKNPYGDLLYWIGYLGEPNDTGLGTDFLANEEGYVTITPLTVDLTETNMLPKVAKLFDSLEF